jgi:DNA-directed RNA polymerase subunit RPC12/RpoP
MGKQLDLEEKYEVELPEPEKKKLKYSCDECGKEFGKPFELNEHKRTHSDQVSNKELIKCRRTLGSTRRVRTCFLFKKLDLYLIRFAEAVRVFLRGMYFILLPSSTLKAT